jgi:hypothetical protein
LRHGLDFAEAELATKIRGKYLRALEQEQFELLPAQTYVRGFLRSYAEYLGLDGQLYVDEYNSRYVTGEEEPTLRPRRSGAGRAQRRVESRGVLVALGAIAAVVALFIAAWKFGGGDEPQALPNLSRTTARTVTARKPERKPKRTPTTVHLVLTAARGDCWLEVHKRSATGPQVFQGTLEQGRSLPLTSKRLWINVGAPENLVVKLNGKRSGFPRGAPSVVIVTRKGITAAPTV